MQSPDPAVNLSELLKRVDNDHELLRELIDIAKVDFPRHLSALREAVAQENRKKVERAGHTLKGSLSALAATRAAAAAVKLEQLAHTGDATALSDALELLENEVARLLRQLEAGVVKVQP